MLMHNVTGLHKNMICRLLLEQIRKAKTGSYVFVTADITFCDAIEDLKFSINME